MPRIQDMIRDISPATFITTLDAVSGYWQIPMSADSIDKTTFVTDRVFLAFYVIWFQMRVKYAFQRVSTKILESHSSYTTCYIDDICVKSNSFDEHLIHIDNVLKAFCLAGMTLRLTKCVFVQPKVKFLGHLVGSGRVQLLPDRFAALQNIAPPTTTKLVRSALGMFVFFEVLYLIFLKLPDRSLN